MSLSALTVLTAAVAVAASTPVPPGLIVYTGPGLTGSSATYYSSQSSLGDMDNAISSVTINGCWVLYANEQFDGRDASVELVLGIRGSMDITGSLDNAVSSVRLVGDPTDASLSGLNLYKGPYMSGEELFIQQDSSNTVTEGGYGSVIVSGPDSWTIFSGEDYSGASVCLESGSTYVWVNDERIEYGIFWASWELGVVGGNIRSARKGCVEGAPRLRAQVNTSRRGDVTVVTRV